jgi:hypothetical protein
MERLLEMSEPRVGPLRQILPVPREVDEFIDEHFPRCAPERRQELRNEYTLAYHFHLVPVVVRMNEKGVEVVARNGEIREYVENTPFEERKDTTLIVPDLWY